MKKIAAVIKVVNWAHLEGLTCDLSQFLIENRGNGKGKKDQLSRK